ncbi:serine hydrolase domain-containing protein [Mucilaginibacter angelicae]|uniref:Serine hydrolase domain-containing protein n=1 Tax=Mucilaginibacter angelicae TaxID=869718 RepID=A0ABV6L3L8_9SPHI
MKKIILSLSLLLLITSIAYAQNKTDTIPDMNDPGKVLAWLKKRNIPALGLAYIEKGKLQSVKVFGNLKPGVAASDNALFNVASLTKPITTMVTLNLVNSGKWQLDEPLFHYWTDPDIKDDPRSLKLTTKDILNHRTGFPNWRSQLKYGKLAFQVDPGTKYGYSGEGFEYLRHALENKFHRTLAQLADSIIFKPLKMRSTGFTWNDKMESRFAVPTDENGKSLEIPKNKEANAADLLKTTVGDYGRFLVWILDGGGLSKELFRQMLDKQVEIKEHVYMGLGWSVYDDLGNGEYGVSHGGRDPGVNTIVFILPNSKRGLLIFTNSDNGSQLYAPLVKAYLKQQGQAILDIELKNQTNK